MKRLILYLTLILVLVISATSHAFAADEQTAEVDKIFAKWDSTHSPGCSMAVIKDGRIIYERGYGMANLEHGITNKPDTVFRIGSMSKEFTAASIAILYLRGQLDLDASIRTYIPELAETYQPVTVSQMIHHTSGIREYFDLLELQGIFDNGYYTSQDVLDILSRQKALHFKEGSQYFYSNSGYFLLGEIVKRVSGKTLAEFAKENIFEPLGMTNTHFHDDCTVIVPNRATGYDEGADGFSISETVIPVVGAGGVFTTVEDIARWDQNFYDNELDKELIDLILTRGKLNDGQEIDYAFGLKYGEYRGLKFVGHSGGYVGFRSRFVRFPEQKFSVVVLCNLSNINPVVLCERVADIYLKNEFTHQEQAQIEKETEKEERITLPAEKLAVFAGSFSNETYNSYWDIEPTGQGLKLIRATYNTELFPVSESVFVGELFGSTLRFEFDGSDKFAYILNGKNVGTFQKFTPPKYSAELLAEFTGDYYSDELDMLYKFELRDGKLYIKYHNSSEEAFKAISSDMFGQYGFGAAKFLRDKNGAVSGFEYSGPNVQGIRFVKR
jgi:CubicO group peptidase (beta-lactamase class C family)